MWEALEPLAQFRGILQSEEFAGIFCENNDL